MVELIPAISNAISLASTLREIGKKIDDAELKNVIADLSLELAQAKIDLAAIQISSLEKDKEISSLHQKLENKSRTVGFLNARYYVSDAGEPKGQPFCSICFAKSFELYPLVNWNSKTNTNKCGVCGNTVDCRMSPLSAETYIEIQKRAARELGKDYQPKINP